MNKTPAGFKFGVNPTRLLRLCGEFQHNGRTYKLAEVKVIVETEPIAHNYYSLRLYNAAGRFIKQFMFEPEALDSIYGLLYAEQGRRSIFGLRDLVRGRE